MESFEYRRVDLTVVCSANIINISMALLFFARMTGLFVMEKAFGITAITIGIGLAYISYLNKKNGRNKSEVYLLIPIALFMGVELFLDYILRLDFRSTVMVGPYVLCYYFSVWMLIGYSFRFEKKWGFITLCTYFLNMFFSIYPYIIK